MLKSAGLSWTANRSRTRVFGAGPIDLLLVQQWAPIDLLWELPQLASFLDKLGAMARVMVFDTLGSGASDRVAFRLASLSETFADVSLALLDAVDSPRAVLFDMTAGQSGATFAAMYPQRVQSVILINLRTSYPELRAMTAAQRARFAKTLHGVRSLEVGNKVVRARTEEVLTHRLLPDGSRTGRPI